MTSDARLAREYIHGIYRRRPCWTFGGRRLGWVRWPCLRCLKRLLARDFRRQRDSERAAHAHVRNAIPTLRRQADGSWKPDRDLPTVTEDAERCGLEFGNGFVCALPKGHA